MTTSTSISVKPRFVARVAAGERSCADYNPAVPRGRACRSAGVHSSFPSCPEPFACSPARRPLAAPSSRGARRGRGGVVDRAAAAAAGVAVHVRREVRRDPQVRRARPRRGRRPADGVPLVVLARLKGVDRAIKAGNYEIGAGHHAAATARQADAGRRDADRFTIVEGSTYAELADALKANPDIAKTVPELPVRGARPADRGARNRASRAGSFPTRTSSPRAPPISRCSRARTA